MPSYKERETAAIAKIREIKKDKTDMKGMLLTVEDKLSAKNKAKFAEMKNKK